MLILSIFMLLCFVNGQVLFEVKQQIYSIYPSEMQIYKHANVSFSVKYGYFGLCQYNNEIIYRPCTSDAEPLDESLGIFCTNVTNEVINSSIFGNYESNKHCVLHYQNGPIVETNCNCNCDVNYNQFCEICSAKESVFLSVPLPNIYDARNDTQCSLHCHDLITRPFGLDLISEVGWQSEGTLRQINQIKNLINEYVKQR